MYLRSSTKVLHSKIVLNFKNFMLTMQLSHQTQLGWYKGRTQTPSFPNQFSEEGSFSFVFFTSQFHVLGGPDRLLNKIQSLVVCKVRLILWFNMVSQADMCLRTSFKLNSVIRALVTALQTAVQKNCLLETLFAGA